MAAQATIEYEGVKVAYSRSAVKSWKVQKRLVTPGADMFSAVDDILLGKSDEVAEKLGDDMESMQELLLKIAEKESDAKN